MALGFRPSITSNKALDPTSAFQVLARSTELVQTLTDYLCRQMWKMSSIRKRKATLWPLALLLFLATVAPKLSLMTCGSSGRTILSIGDGKECCPAKSQAGDELDISCCAFSSVQAELPTFTSSVVAVPAPVFAVAVPWASVIMAPRTGHAFSDGPQSRPPRLLSDRLAVLQVFRI